MKHDLKLKDLLIGTGGCLLLTFIQFLGDSLRPTLRGYRDGLELLILWLVIVVAWGIYLVRLIRKRRKDPEEDPWNRKEKEPW